jgi:hypothetical protein
MNTLPRTLAIILVAAPLVRAQQIRHEITQPANPAEDTRPNNNKVPDATTSSYRNTST